MIQEIETCQEIIITRIKDHWHASETKSLQSEAPNATRYHDYPSKFNIPPVSDTKYVQSLDSSKDLVR